MAFVYVNSSDYSCFKKLSNRWFCVIGGFILLLSFSADFSYPNINTYLTSYMRNNATNGYNNDLTYDDWVFLTTTKVVVQGGSMPFIGVLCRKIGCWMSIFIGSAIYSIGFMLTYFTVQSYFTLAILTLAAHGFAFCFVYATSIGAAQKWFPKSQKGFIGSIVLSGYGYGSLICSFANKKGLRDNCRFEIVDRFRWNCFINAVINFYPLFQKMLRSCCLFTLFGCIVGPPVPSTSPGQGYPGYLGNNYNGWTPWQNYFNYYLQRYFQSKS